MWKAFSQENTINDDILKTILKNGRKFLKNKNINSVSIGIYKDGQVYIEHFGEIEKSKSNLPNDETIYEVGSVTKTITVYLVKGCIGRGN